MAVAAASAEEALEALEVGSRPPSAAGLEEGVPLAAVAVGGSNNTGSNSSNLLPSPEGLVAEGTG